MSSVDGIYSGYFSGEGGNGLGLFLFREGLLSGADAFGVKFDGTYAQAGPGAAFVGKVTVVAPPNGTLVQGVSTGPSGLTYEVDIEIPADFIEKPFLLIKTPLGPVNVKLVKLRDL